MVRPCHSTYVASIGILYLWKLTCVIVLTYSDLVQWLDLPINIVWNLLQSCFVSFHQTKVSSLNIQQSQNYVLVDTDCYSHMTSSLCCESLDQSVVWFGVCALKSCAIIMISFISSIGCYGFPSNHNFQYLFPRPNVVPERGWREPYIVKGILELVATFAYLLIRYYLTVPNNWQLTVPNNWQLTVLNWQLSNNCA